MNIIIGFWAIILSVLLFAATFWSKTEKEVEDEKWFLFGSALFLIAAAIAFK